MKKIFVYFIILFFLSLWVSAFAANPTAGQFLFQQKQESGPFLPFGVTPENGKAFGFDGSGNLGMIAVGVGDVEGPASSVDNAIVAFDGTTGKLIKSSGLLITDLITDSILDAWTGSENITTLGTITTGIWQGSPVVDAYISSAATWNAKEPPISVGTTAQYWRGDKSWQTLNSAAVGLGNVENIALSTWAGSASIANVGTITTGVWQATPVADMYVAGAALWNTALQPGDDVSDLVNDAGYLVAADIAGKADKTTTITGGTGLAGGGDLSANRVISLSAGSIASLVLADTALQPSDIGITVQAWDAQLDDLAGLAPNNGIFIVGDGANFVAEAGSTARDSLGLGVSDSVTFASVDSNGSVSFAGPGEGKSYLFSDASVDRNITTPDKAGYMPIVADSGGLVDVSDEVTGTLPVSSGGTGSTSASDARISLGLAIGANVQAFDVGLLSIAGLTTAANTGIYTTALDTYATYSLTAGGRALGGVAGTANTIPYFSASNTASLLTTTTGGRALLNNAGTANTFPYYSASNTVSLSGITATGRLLANSADAAAARTTISAIGGSTGVTDNALLVADGTGGATLKTTGNVAFINGARIGTGPGTFNVLFGEQALNALTTGGTNVALGLGSMLSLTTGSGNMGIGTYSLASNVDGPNNVGVGGGSLNGLTTGTGNVSIGTNSGGFLTSGDYGTYIGYGTRGTTGAFSETVIGHDAIGLGSNTVVIGRPEVTLTRLQGEVESMGGEFRVYGTYTSSSNFEALTFIAGASENQIKPTAGGGGGTARPTSYHTTDTGVRFMSGAGTPEGVVSAPVGSLYTRTDGGASTTLYVKESGTGNTGWVAK